MSSNLPICQRCKTLYTPKNKTNMCLKCLEEIFLERGKEINILKTQVEALSHLAESYTEKYEQEKEAHDVTLRFLDKYQAFAPARLAEILDTEQEGRLVVLPCKVGDTVYVITRCEDIIMHHDNDYINGTGAVNCPFEGSCVFYDCDDEQIQVLETVCTGFWFEENIHGGIFLEHISSEVYISNFGKTIFLSRDEAEAALKEADHEPE